MTHAQLPLRSKDAVMVLRDVGIHLRPTNHQPKGRVLLKGCHLTLAAGQRVTLVGASGAGKSLLAQAIMGTLPAAMGVTGHIQILGRETNGVRQRTQPLWGRDIVMLPQEPWAALNPVMRLRTQVAEASRYALGKPWRPALEQADRHLAALGLSQAGWKWLHQVSGGMAQRVGVACASQSDARILIADEPTKGLDADACDQVAQLLASAQREGQALLTITHDLALAMRLGGTLVVMRDGEIVESGAAADVLSHPQHPYSQSLVAAQPRHWPRLAPPAGAGFAAQAVVRAEGLQASWNQHTVLNGVNLSIGASESVAVVGPSGCGKTTLGNVLVGVRQANGGQIFRRAHTAPWRFQKLYQDPVAAFAPQQTLRRGLTDLIQRHRLNGNAVPTWLERLGLTDDLLDRRPDEVSGGELQRISLLRALLLEPVFVFADEPTSRLDAITQRATMTALCNALSQTESALLLVSHDPHLAARATHRQLVLAEGRLQPLPEAAP